MSQSEGFKWKKADYAKFKDSAKKIVKDRVYDSYLLRYAYGIDASCYSYIPQIVVKAMNEDEIKELFKIARACQTPITFRAAGSSLCGQSSSDSVLIVVNEGWKNYAIKEGGNSISLDAGIIGSDANALLQPYGTRIGPDPATISTALIGGILNNNSSGMCCGVAQNSYNTIKSLRVILSDSYVVDTADEASVMGFIKTHPKMVEDILKLKEQILADSELKELIARKYKIKNTTGYSINSLLEFDDIKEILNHIFVGSEGTLGFVSRVDYNCVKIPPFTGCGLLFYESLDVASICVTRLGALKPSVIRAAEMMDWACLKSVADINGVPEVLKQIPQGSCCILIQSEADTHEELINNLEEIKNLLSDISTNTPPVFSQDAKIYSSWWKIRKGILPIAAAKRRPQSTTIVEDVCFKIKDFCDGAKMIENLFLKHGFSEHGVIFGHALSGNLHFIITPDFNNPVEYEAFCELVKDMSLEVAKMEGSIKAEHGTGRMVAPFVELEWGKKAYDINKKIKQIFDPLNLINPDVIITDDPEIYRKNLKAATQIDEIYNGCMECGACERNCPSKNLTLTPRQRIGLLREMARLKELGARVRLEELTRDYEYYGEKTCAACSMCSQLCPLQIDTANIALDLRKKLSGNTLNLAQKIYNNMDKTVKLAKFGLNLCQKTSRIIGANSVSKITNFLHTKFNFFPYAPTIMPSPNKYQLKSKIESKNTRSVLYFTSCMNRAFAPNKSFNDQRSVQEVFESICQKAGVNVIYPNDIDKMCCGIGFEAYDQITQKNSILVRKWLENESKNGELDIIIDHSACFAHTFLHIQKGSNLRIFDMAEYLCTLVDNLKITKSDIGVIVHKQCEIKKLNKDEFIEKIARICSDRVFNIDSFECCGFAGQKGFFTPQLNLSATKDLKKEVKFKFINIGVSTSSTCQIGLSSNSGIEFVNIAYLLDSHSTKR